jgi:hypothetical protein
VDAVEKNVVIEAFERHNMHGSHEDIIGVSEMVKVLTFIFDKLDPKEKEDVDIPLSIDLSLNWLLNVYDRLVFIVYPSSLWKWRPNLLNGIF